MDAILKKIRFVSLNRSNPFQMKNLAIKCPKCHWEPDGKAYWQCSCGHVWDTFSTQGVCPKCHKRWQDTSCILHAGGCTAWSPHIDWYHIPLDMEKLLEKKEEAL